MIELISHSTALSKDSKVEIRNLINIVAGLIMAACYTLCVIMLTFENGPATYVSDQYFATWAGFFLSFSILGSTLEDIVLSSLNENTEAEAQVDAEAAAQSEANIVTIAATDTCINGELPSPVLADDVVVICPVAEAGS